MMVHSQIRRGFSGLGFACPVAPTTDYQLSNVTGTKIPMSSAVLSTMADVNELIADFAPFYPGQNPIVQEDQNPTFIDQYVDGTGRKNYTIGYPGGAVYNVGQTLANKCTQPGLSWQPVTLSNGRINPQWTTPAIAASRSAASHATTGHPASGSGSSAGVYIPPVGASSDGSLSTTGGSSAGASGSVSTLSSGTSWLLLAALGIGAWLLLGKGK